uniref:Uncharacterized protein n=1 Tax=Oryza glumipatula TaxID=40148 RepID=A0A0E0ADU1_9ORYZ
MSKKRREGGGGGNGGCDPPVTDALSMDSGLREVSLSVVFSVWCLLLLRSQCHGSINVMSPWRLIDLFFVDFYDDVEDGMRENYCKPDPAGQGRERPRPRRRGGPPARAKRRGVQLRGGVQGRAKVLAHNREAKGAANFLGATLLRCHTAPPPPPLLCRHTAPPSAPTSVPSAPPHSPHLADRTRRPPVPAFVLAVRERKE